MEAGTEASRTEAKCCLLNDDQSEMLTFRARSVHGANKGLTDDEGEGISSPQVKFAESEDEETYLPLVGVEGTSRDEFGDEAIKSARVQFAESEDESSSQGTSLVGFGDEAKNSAGIKFADSEEEEDSSQTFSEFVNNSIKSAEANKLEDLPSPRMVPLPNKVFVKNMSPKIYKLSVKKNCSKLCMKKCELIVASWSPEKILEMKSSLKGKSSTESKNKLLKHLHDQKKFHATCPADVLVYHGHSFCKSFLSVFLGLSYYIIKTVFFDYGAGLVRYVHGNVENIRESLASVKCTSWVMIHIAIHGQNSPDEILTVLPSYMTKAELYRTYVQETSGRKLKKSSFYKHFKNKFGPKRQDRNLPQVRISRYSSHSVV